MAVFNEYFKTWEEYRNKYENDIVLLYQVGSFYQMYNYQTEQAEGFFVQDDEDEDEDNKIVIDPSTVINIKPNTGNCRIISSKIGLAVRQINPDKCKGLKYIYTSGFNVIQLDSRLRTILEMNCIVVVMSQVGQQQGKKLMERVVTQVATPASSLTCGAGIVTKSEPIKLNGVSSTNNYIVYLYIEPNERKQKEFADCIYIEKLNEVQQNNLFKSLPVIIGVAAIDMFTGKNIVYQINSKQENHLYALQELYRFITCFYPKELLLSIVGLENHLSPPVSPAVASAAAAFQPLTSSIDLSSLNL